MKRISFNIILLVLLTTMTVTTACESKLDIIPKGQVTLQHVSELELLLNQEYSITAVPAGDLGIICGETVGMFDQVTSILSQPNTCKYAFLTGDETVDRAVLTTQDSRYSNIYSYINYMNVVINHMPKAVGNELVKPQLLAEAHVMRAYMHWLAVSIYAKQYDEKTAENEGGIAYSTSTEVQDQRTKLSLKESYQRILEDLDDAYIAQMPLDHNETVMRGDQAWGNAVKAMVLLQMKRYADAIPYAEKAISIRPYLFDRSSIKTTGIWSQDMREKSYFLYMNTGIRVSPTMVLLSLYTGSLFEEGDYVQRYEKDGGFDLFQGQNYSGIEGVRALMSFATSCNVWGLTVEQLHYALAECLIRTGSINEGLALVDKVRVMRVEDPQPFVGTASDEQSAMQLLQKAKWLENLGSPFNFFDVKRWNSEPQYARTVVHDLGHLGKYTISPNSPLWVMPFPSNATRFNKSLTQNY